METFSPRGRRIFARSTASDVFRVQCVNRPYYNFMARSPLKTATAAVRREIKFACAACICRVWTAEIYSGVVVGLWSGLSGSIRAPRDSRAEKIDVDYHIGPPYTLQPLALMSFCLGQLILIIVFRNSDLGDTVLLFKLTFLIFMFDLIC